MKFPLSKLDIKFHNFFKDINRVIYFIPHEGDVHSDRHDIFKTCIRVQVNPLEIKILRQS